MLYTLPRQHRLQHRPRVPDVVNLAREAAAVLRVAAITIHRALAQQKLGCYRIGRRVVIGENHLEVFKKESERPARAKAFGL